MSGDKHLGGDKHISLSVTELVEFSARRGNLFDHIEGPTSAEGIAAHKKIQKSRDNSWESEIPVETTRSLMNYTVKVRGRIDLLKKDLTGILIEEIKTVLVNPEDIPESRQALHLDQAKVYAALLFLEDESRNSKNDSLNTFEVRLTWFNISNQTSNTKTYHFTSNELVERLDALITIYLQWYSTYNDVVARNRLSAKSLDFPFSTFRPNQREFSAAVYHSIHKSQDCLFEAPTGVGKTISTLFPAIKSFASGHIHQLVYLTAKVATQQLAVTTLKTLNKQGLLISAVVIQAKDRTCPCLQENAPNCRNAEGDCTRTLDFYERLPKARLECLKHALLTPDKLQEIAENNHLCPFELSLQMAKWSNVIIADVNYVYDPLVRLPFFNERGNKRAILIDEAHNLVERGRMMYSAELNAQEVKHVENISILPIECKKTLKKLQRKINQSMHGVFESNNTPPKEANALTKLAEESTRLLTEFSLLGRKSAQFDLLSEGNIHAFKVNDLTKKLIRFLTISELENTTHVHCISRLNDSKHNTYEIFCRDASNFLQALHKKNRSTVCFSATLRPTDFFINTLGFNSDTLRYSVPSSFPSKNQLTLICAHVDTRFKNREKSLNTLVTLICDIYERCEGNAIVYFPSFNYLETTRIALEEQCPKISTQIVCQQPNTNPHEQQLFLKNFVSTHQRSLGFAIAGGVFGEGIDFSGESLAAAIVIGTGMPPPSHHTRALQNYFDAMQLPGFEYTYRYPGFIRILQTAGRVIRSETDKGIVALVDPRFQNNEYIQLMPTHWALHHCKNEHDVRDALLAFYS